MAVQKVGAIAYAKLVAHNKDIGGHQHDDGWDCYPRPRYFAAGVEILLCNAQISENHTTPLGGSSGTAILTC